MAVCRALALSPTGSGQQRLLRLPEARTGSTGKRQVDRSLEACRGWTGHMPHSPWALQRATAGHQESAHTAAGPL